MGNVFTSVVNVVLNSNIPFLRRFANQQIINYLANLVEPRPRPFSMAGERGNYTTWRGMTDRRFSGRQLPPPDEPQNLPPVEKVLDLFRRETEQLDDRTTLLLPFFAQWFTDSFLRTKFQPPDVQDFSLNESNHEIDLNQIYGMREEHTTMLRARKGGRLKSQMINNEEWPLFLFDHATLEIKPEFQGLYTETNFKRVFANTSDDHKRNSFAVGLEHGNSTIQNTLMNTLFLREHNRIAGIIAAAHSDWDDERVFQTTRNCMIVILIKIVIGDYVAQISSVNLFLPEDMGFAEDQKWYKENWMSVEFNLLYRWHDLIPSNFSMNGVERSSFSMLNNNALLIEVGSAQALKDASNQKAGRLALGNTPDFLLHVTELSLHMARTVQLQPYVKYCEEYGERPPRTFRELTGETEVAAKLEAVYGSVDQVEWFVGLFAGKPRYKGGFGSILMINMVGNDAVTQALTNPLLAKRVYNSKTFSPEGLEIIESFEGIADLVVQNSTVENKSDVGFGFNRGK